MGRPKRNASSKRKSPGQGVTSPAKKKKVERSKLRKNKTKKEESKPSKSTEIKESAMKVSGTGGGAGEGGGEGGGATEGVGAGAREIAGAGEGAGAGHSNLSAHLTEPSWQECLEPIFHGENYQRLQEKLQEETENGVQIFPPPHQVFAAFNMTPFHQVKVVIIGQDPYHDDGQAEGLSFSVPVGCKIPRSLDNIYKELSFEYPEQFQPPSHGHLGGWARQGVLLINAALTVRAHEPNSHARLGWLTFTDDVLRILGDTGARVFLLWGNFAHRKEKLITSPPHVVIKTAHPSPLSWNKFQGCGCFRAVNEALERLGHKPVDWGDLRTDDALLTGHGIDGNFLTNETAGI